MTFTTSYPAEPSRCNQRTREPAFKGPFSAATARRDRSGVFAKLCSSLTVHVKSPRSTEERNARARGFVRGHSYTVRAIYAGKKRHSPQRPKPSRYRLNPLWSRQNDRSVAATACRQNACLIRTQYRKRAVHKNRKMMQIVQDVNFRTDP